MKKLYFLVVVLFVVESVNAQNPDDIVNIPDEYFKSYLINANPNNGSIKDSDGNLIQVDINGDSEIQFSEAQLVYELSVSSSALSLEGIQSFSNLRMLECTPTNISSLDLTGLHNLEDLNCYNGSLTSLTIAGLPNLKKVYCGSNAITNLDLTGLPNLEVLSCDYNQITNLNASMLSNLQTLSCSNNAMVSLNLTGLVSLKELICMDNQLNSLDMADLDSLISLSCSSNNLTVLDLSSLSTLTGFSCSQNPITSLNVSGLSNLRTLDASGCPITSLNTTGLDSIENLYVMQCSLTSLDVNELDTLTYLNCTGNSLSNLNVSGAISLMEISCSFNQLTSLDLSGMSNLLDADCSYNNQMTSLNLIGTENITNLKCSNNHLMSLDLLAMSNLSYLDCSNNQLTSLDLSNTTNLTTEQFSAHTNQLQSLLIKNGIFDGLTQYSISNNPSLQYICADENEITSLQFMVSQLGYNCTINSYCSFIPGGVSNIINGNITLDANNNGCDVSDINIPSLKLNITGDSQAGSLISNQSGEYLIPVQAGTHTITPVFENLNYFNVSPATVSVTFPATTSPFAQNFCITPNGLHPDLEVAILPTTPARPGFDADYKIIIKNKGNIQQSGSVSFVYDDAVLDYINASPAFSTQVGGSLSWTFANLQPFETREINVMLNVNSPMETPAVNGDDVLNYTATITSDQIDELPLDNTFVLPQIVVNSFDPNDKTCLEGTSITPDMIGKYVHYMIRFENTGTFAAQNIVVKDMIDTAKFDVSSLVALNGSHSYVTRITGNKVEFIFEAINLAFDDASNDGYVVFKIKTLPTLVLGNSFSNTASIYFDFNHPIITEPAVTTFAELGTEDFDFNNYFTLYPNPASGVLNITSKQAIEMQNISIYNVLGQMVVSVPNAKGVNSVDVSSLPTGNYFIKVVSDKGTSNSKFIRQ